MASPEVGLKLTEYFNESIAVEAGLSYAPTLKSSTKTLSPMTAYSVGGTLKLFSVMSGVQAYANAGMWGVFETDSISPDGYVGGGIKYMINEFSTTKLEGRVGVARSGLGDMAIYLGFEKLLGPAYVASVPPVQEEPKPAAVASANSIKPATPSASATPQPTNIYMKVPATIYCLIPQDLVLKDVQRHWAKTAIETVASYGIITPSYETFEPAQTLTRFEASKMTVTAIYLQRLIEKSAASVRFSVKGRSGTPYRVTLIVKDAGGKEVKRLYDLERFYNGNYDIEWDGTDTLGSKVKQGRYQFQCELSDEARVLDSTKADIELITFSKPIFDPYSPTISFYEPIDPEWAKEVVDESIKRGIIDLNFAIDNQVSATKISKIDFIVGVSKGLKLLGAETKAAVPDLSLYKDKDAIPSYAFNFLNTYTSELGYGGTKAASSLEPLKEITRAEAASILFRLINWKRPVYK